MNDESKKLKLFNKLIDHEEAGTPFEIREIWIDAFEEVLGIIGREYARGRRGVTALENVRRAICDELGLTDDEPKTVEPDSMCPFVFGNKDCGYDGPFIHSDCDKTFGNCKRLGNVVNFGGIGYDKMPAGEDYCDCRIAKSIVTTYGDGSRTIECKKCGHTTEYGRE